MADYKGEAAGLHGDDLEMLLQKLAEEWIEDKRLICTKRTIKAYRNTLNQFIAWSGAKTTHRSFTAQLVQGFVGYLREKRVDGRPMNPNTIRGYLTHLGSFGEWLVQQEWLETNPIKEVKKPRRQQAQRRVASVDEVKAMLAACDKLPDKRIRMPDGTWSKPGRYPAKARAVISLLAYGGLRSGEIIGLTLDDIHLSQRCIMVTGKGQKRARVDLPDEAIQALRNWLSFRGLLPIKALFEATPRRPMGHVVYYEIWRAVRSVAGLGEETDLNPHGFRHNFADRLFRGGASLSEIQAALRHPSGDVTVRYLESATTDREHIRQLASLEPKEKPQPKARAQREIPEQRYRITRKETRWK